MGKDKGLEELRALFADQRQHSAIGLITKLGALADRSALRVRVKLFPDEREIIATMTWDAVGPNAGDFEFPEVDDLVLVQMIGGDPDQAYVTRRLTSKVDVFPAAALDGHQVRQARIGKKTYLASDTRVVLGLPDSEGDEPLVLGATLQGLLSSVLGLLVTQADDIKALADELTTMATNLAAHGHTAAGAGPPITAALFTTHAVQLGLSSGAMAATSMALDDEKASPVDDSAMLSDLVYTEKGGA